MERVLPPPLKSRIKMWHLYCPSVAHVQYPYISGYDLFPLETLENKKKVLQQAFEEHWLLIFQHDPKVRMGYLKKINGRFEVEEVKI